MTRRENLKAKALEEDEEEEITKGSKSAISPIISDDSEEEEERKRLRSVMYEESDDEVIEDPMSKIVEKSLLVCEENKIDQNNNDFDVVSITRADGVVEFSSVDAVKTKKKKKQSVSSSDVEEKSVIATMETEKVETDGILEGVEKGEKVEMVELEESADPDAVDQTDNIVMRKLLRAPRYFDPPNSGWSACFNCGEEGHMAVRCPSLKKRKKPCFVCGGFDHGAKQCPKGQDCFICKQGGHRAKDCPDKKKGSQPVSKICLKCGDAGHDIFSCRNNYSEDDLKEIQCYICKNFGHLCCVISINDNPKEVSCYKCGELGHSGLACLRLREDADNAASPSSCFRCHEVGHFARECPNSAKVIDGGSYSGSCRKCGDVGHFARECTSTAKQKKKRNRELSTPSRKARREKGNLEVKSAPPEREKGRKRKKQKSEGKGNTTPQKPKHRGGWTMEDPGEVSNSKATKNRWQSCKTPPNAHKIRIITSGSHPSSSRSPKKVQNHYYPQTPRYGVRNYHPSTSPCVVQDRYPAVQHYYPGPGTLPQAVQNHYPGLGTSPYTVQNHYHGSSPYPVQNGTSPYDRRHAAPRYDHKFTASRFDNSAVRHKNFHGTGERRYYDW